MPLSRISQKQILARVTLNATDGSATDAGDFIVQNTSADENDNLVLEEHTDFGTDILVPPKLIALSVVVFPKVKVEFPEPVHSNPNTT